MASLKYQIVERMRSMQKFGQSKHQAKQQERERCQREGISWNPARVQGIFSKGTFDSYLKENMQFAEYCQQNNANKFKKITLEHVKNYMQSLIDKKHSPSSIKLAAAAINKVFEKNLQGQKVQNLVELPRRSREKITRSRGTKDHDRGFSLKNNAELIRFCKAVGLRRHELAKLQGKDIAVNPRTNELVLHVIGKGGKYRETRVVQSERAFVQGYQNREGILFAKIPNKADIHSFRRDYAAAKYAEYLKYENLRSNKFWNRRDGRKFDKAILAQVSKDLGHNRIEIVVSNYLD